MAQSIYGEPFEDENFDLTFSQPGLLAMAGSMPMRSKAEEEMMHVPHRNTSQFFITTKERNHAQVQTLSARHQPWGLVFCFFSLSPPTLLGAHQPWAV